MVDLSLMEEDVIIKDVLRLARREESRYRLDDLLQNYDRALKVHQISPGDVVAIRAYRQILQLCSQVTPPVPESVKEKTKEPLSPGHRFGETWNSQDIRVAQHRVRALRGQAEDSGQCLAQVSGDRSLIFRVFLQWVAHHRRRVALRLRADLQFIGRWRALMEAAWLGWTDILRDREMQNFRVKSLRRLQALRDLFQICRQWRDWAHFRQLVQSRRPPQSRIQPIFQHWFTEMREAKFLGDRLVLLDQGKTWECPDYQGGFILISYEAGLSLGNLTRFPVKPFQRKLALRVAISQWLIWHRHRQQMETKEALQRNKIREWHLQKVVQILKAHSVFCWRTHSSQRQTQNFYERLLISRGFRVWLNARRQGLVCDRLWIRCRRREHERTWAVASLFFQALEERLALRARVIQFQNRRRGLAEALPGVLEVFQEWHCRYQENRAPRWQAAERYQRRRLHRSFLGWRQLVTLKLQTLVNQQVAVARNHQTLLDKGFAGLYMYYWAKLTQEHRMLNGLLANSWLIFIFLSQARQSLGYPPEKYLLDGPSLLSVPAKRLRVDAAVAPKLEPALLKRAFLPWLVRTRRFSSFLVERRFYLQIKVLQAWMGRVQMVKTIKQLQFYRPPLGVDRAFAHMLTKFRTYSRFRVEIQDFQERRMWDLLYVGLSSWLLWVLTRKACVAKLVAWRKSQFIKLWHQWGAQTGICRGLQRLARCWQHRGLQVGWHHWRQASGHQQIREYQALEAWCRTYFAEILRSWREVAKLRRLSRQFPRISRKSHEKYLFAVWKNETLKEKRRSILVHLMGSKLDKKRMAMGFRSWQEAILTDKFERDNRKERENACKLQVLEAWQLVLTQQKLVRHMQRKYHNYLMLLFYDWLDLAQLQGRVRKFGHKWRQTRSVFAYWQFSKEKRCILREIQGLLRDRQHNAWLISLMAHWRGQNQEAANIRQGLALLAKMSIRHCHRLGFDTWFNMAREDQFEKLSLQKIQQSTLQKWALILHRKPLTQLQTQWGPQFLGRRFVRHWRFRLVVRQKFTQNLSAFQERLYEHQMSLWFQGWKGVRQQNHKDRLRLRSFIENLQASLEGAAFLEWRQLIRLKASLKLKHLRARHFYGQIALTKALRQWRLFVFESSHEKEVLQFYWKAWLLFKLEGQKQKLITNKRVQHRQTQEIQLVWTSWIQACWQSRLQRQGLRLALLYWKSQVHHLLRHRQWLKEVWQAWKTSHEQRQTCRALVIQCRPEDCPIRRPFRLWAWSAQNRQAHYRLVVFNRVFTSWLSLRLTTLERTRVVARKEGLNLDLLASRVLKGWFKLAKYRSRLQGQVQARRAALEHKKSVASFHGWHDVYQTSQFGRRILSRQFGGWHQEFWHRQILKKVKPLLHKVLQGWHRLVETRAVIRSLIPKNRSYFTRWRECWLIARAQDRRTKEALAESFSSWRSRTNLEKLARPLNQVVLRQAATFWLDAHREFQALIRGVPQLSPIFQDILNFRKQGLAVALKVLKQHSRQRKSLELLETRVHQDQRLRVLGLFVGSWSLHVRQLRAHQFHRKTLCLKLMVAWQRGAQESQSRGALRKLGFLFRRYTILSYWRRSAQVASRASLCLQRVRSHTVHQVWRAWLHVCRLRGHLRDLQQSQSEALKTGLKYRIWHQWWGDFQRNWEPYGRYRLKEGQNLKLNVWQAWKRLIYQSAKLRDTHFLKACLQAWRLVSQEKKMINDLLKSARQLGYSRNSEFSRSGISRETQNSMTSSTDTRFLKSFEDALETPFEYRLDRRRSVG